MTQAKTMRGLLLAIALTGAAANDCADYAADEQPDAAVGVLIPGGPPARPTPGLAHYTPPRRRY